MLLKGAFKPQIDPLCLFPLPQVCQVSAQQPVQTELLMRYHQLQSRLTTLKIENEEVRIYEVSVSGQHHNHPSLSGPPPLKQRALSHFPQSQVGGPHHHLFLSQLLSNDPCSPGAENTFRWSQRQGCVFYDVIYESDDWTMKRAHSHWEIQI